MSAASLTHNFVIPSGAIRSRSERIAESRDLVFPPQASLHPKPADRSRRQFSPVTLSSRAEQSGREANALRSRGTLCSPQLSLHPNLLIDLGGNSHP